MAFPTFFMEVPVSTRDSMSKSTERFVYMSAWLFQTGARERLQHGHGNSFRKVQGVLVEGALGYAHTLGGMSGEQMMRF